MPNSGQTDPKDFHEFTIGNGDRQGALDWRSDGIGAEVKGEAFIGEAAGVSDQKGRKSSPKDIPERHRLTKLDQCWQHGLDPDGHRIGRPLQPALVRSYVDPHDGVQHMFVYKYPGRWTSKGQWIPGTDVDGKFVPDPKGKPKVFGGARTPVDMMEKLVAGELEPGTTKGGWTFVGTVPLRLNPTVMPSERLAALGAEPGSRLTADQAKVVVGGPLEAPGPIVASGSRETIRPTPARRAETLPPQAGRGTPRAPKATGPTRFEIQARNQKRAVELAIKNPRWRHADIADKISDETSTNVSTSAVQKHLKRWIEEPTTAKEREHRRLKVGVDRGTRRPGPGR